MDCFGLGGVLIDREDLDRVWDAHREFCSAWGITYPLHSYEIRGGRGNFSWLKNPERAVEFLPELEEFLVNLPVMGNPQPSSIVLDTWHAMPNGMKVAPGVWIRQHSRF